MTPKERLFNRLAGKPVDRMPNLNIVMLFAAQHCGYDYGPFCSDYRVLVDAMTRTAKDFKIDILSTMSDPFREASDYGAKVEIPQDDLPIMRDVLVHDLDEHDKIKAFDPVASKRMGDRIKAIRLFKEQDGDEYPILGWIEGPWAEFTDLADITEAMMMIIDDPDAVCESLDVITDQAIRCAEAQIEAGADVIGMGDAAASLISRKMYMEYIHPREKKIVEAIHKAGAYVKLHICGDINHIVADMIDTGADIVDIDYMVNYDRAIELSQGRCAISGHINPTATVYKGTPEENRQWVRYYAEHGNERTIVSSGCEIPRMTPEENVMAIADEIQKIADEKNQE